MLQGILVSRTPAGKASEHGQGACVAVGGLTLDSHWVATPAYVAGFNHLLQMLVFAFGRTLRSLSRRVRSCYPRDWQASNFCSGLRGVDTPPRQRLDTGPVRYPSYPQS